MNTFYTLATRYDSKSDDTVQVSSPDLTNLRDAYDWLHGVGGTHSCGLMNIQAGDNHFRCAGYITATAAADYIDGTIEQRTVFFPETMTHSTRARVCRALMS